MCSRAVLLFAIVDIGYPAMNYMAEPVVMGATEGINFWAPSSASIARVQLATYPLAMLAATTFCLLVPRYMLFGLGLLCLVNAAALCGYLMGMWIEGPTARTSLFLEREMVVTSIYLLAFVIEWQRSRLVAAADMRNRTQTPAIEA